MEHLIRDTGIALMAATVLGLFAHWSRQPVILGYLLAGALIGPHIGLGIVGDVENIQIMAEIGLILLLFIVGLEINFKQVVAAGKQLLAVGLGQFPICVGTGILFFYLCGYPLGREAVYLAVACALSSTAIVVKALYDKGEVDTLPGRLTLGVLIFQDLFAIFVLALQPNLADPKLWPVIRSLLSTVVLVAFGLAVSHYILRRIFQSVAKTPEMVVCVAIAWCAAVAALAEWLHLSMEMGALVAGLSISAFPYSVHVSAKALPLRDFFLTLFFVSIGMSMKLPESSTFATVGLVIVFTILSRFFSVYPLTAATGAGRRAAFVSSINLAQLSEFSLVIASLGMHLGHIGDRTVSALILAMSILAVISSYAIRFSHPLFLRFEAAISRILPERAQRMHTEVLRKGHNCEIVFFGFHRAGRALVKALLDTRPDFASKILVIDFNPQTLEEVRAQGVQTMFGDVGSLDTLVHAHLEHSKIILCTIPDMLLRGVDNVTLCRFARHLAPQAVIVATANDLHHEMALQKEGVDLAARPFDVMGEWLAKFVVESVTSDRAWRETVTQVTATGRWMAIK